MDAKLHKRIVKKVLGIVEKLGLPCVKAAPLC